MVYEVTGKLSISPYILTVKATWPAKRLEKEYILMTVKFVSYFSVAQTMLLYDKQTK